MMGGRLAAQARYLTSVCTGSLLLGAAGLLQGRRAARHWAFRELLPLFGAIPDARRVVRDGVRARAAIRRGPPGECTPGDRAAQALARGFAQTQRV